MSKMVPALFALLIVSVGGIYGLDAALETAGSNERVVNETWTPSAGSVTTLAKSNIDSAYYAHNVTVYDEDDAIDGRQEMDAGSDYRWVVGNGTVKALSGGELDGDDNATITYAYEQTSQEQRGLTTLLSNIPTVVGLIAPVFAFLLFVRFLFG